ncbi:squalene--hopene cyclase [Paenibacillus filicis]|uniref:Squalene--hopene cyclase n=1 Tax=Paenibacillus gyeongsangnamensis TaxID=3388067 RepID=A0ABT4QFD6_9BACL|nr:squalene--hopene cyclase [Paenibacillus filicis]MCZ8515591.1 squalene--hopene cyclase [Paenibacillus filicis]
MREERKRKDGQAAEGSPPEGEARSRTAGMEKQSSGGTGRTDETAANGRGFPRAAPLLLQAREAMERLVRELLERQAGDGSWRYCFEMGSMTDAFMIIASRALGFEDDALIGRLCQRILRKQSPGGGWKLFADDEAEGNLDASAEAYCALSLSGCVPASSEAMQRAERFIRKKGGLRQVRSLLTKLMLAVVGASRWPEAAPVPIELLLLPPSFPLSLYDFSGFGRVHLVPALILADRRFVVPLPGLPDWSPVQSAEGVRSVSDPWSELQLSRHRSLLQLLQQHGPKLAETQEQLHAKAVQAAERFMLERIEPDGMLYSYASATFLMIFALLALGYDKQDAVLRNAWEGMRRWACYGDGEAHIQNSGCTVWDTALIAHALQEAGVASDHPAIRQASSYLLSRQHTRFGDWKLHAPSGTQPGGWGFSDGNTRFPDVDDTTAALRALKPSAAGQDAWNRGLQWVVAMQNADGGWPAFERATDLELLSWLPIDGAEFAAVDPSSADLTGRALQFLGTFAGLRRNLSIIRRGTEWLLQHQEPDGSWYGRWGICYLYGTWAALTGLAAAGLPPEHEAIAKAADWLRKTQNADGSWGESCRSDRQRRYVPLGSGTLSQTAWAVDALISVSVKSSPELERGVRWLSEARLRPPHWTDSYPTGSGLPGTFYIRYHSYNTIWPLLALAHYIRKFG